MKRLSTFTVALAVLGSLVGFAERANAQDILASLKPSGAFVQLGSVRQTHTLTEGLTWNWGRGWTVGLFRLSGYWEASISEWSYPEMGDRKHAWLGQIGAIPVFRFRPDDGESPWFGELGVGATFTTNLYQTDRKRFSTTFNFGDHIAIGRNFGDRQEHEIALRVEHFSNAGIKHPNPGENFVQLRYSYSFH
jgi:lipid A 3-O-deacylase